MIDLNDTRKLFLFIDESGDPGHVSLPDASSYYQLNILIATPTGIAQVARYISRFRYFLDAGKELKRYASYNSVLIDMLRLLHDSEQIEMKCFHIHKQEYVGPYLRKPEGKYGYNPKLFRNFIIRKSLEHVFSSKNLSRELEIELVFDRFLVSQEEERNLIRYLRENYSLPNFLHITQIDSCYSEQLQIADYVGRAVKDLLVDAKNNRAGEFIEIYWLNTPDNPEKRKGPGPSI